MPLPLLAQDGAHCIAGGLVLARLCQVKCERELTCALGDTSVLAQHQTLSATDALYSGTALKMTPQVESTVRLVPITNGSTLEPTHGQTSKAKQSGRAIPKHPAAAAI